VRRSYLGTKVNLTHVCRASWPVHHRYLLHVFLPHHPTSMYGAFSSPFSFPTTHSPSCHHPQSVALPEIAPPSPTKAPTVSGTLSFARHIRTHQPFTVQSLGLTARMPVRIDRIPSDTLVHILEYLDTEADLDSALEAHQCFRLPYYAEPIRRQLYRNEFLRSTNDIAIRPRADFSKITWRAKRWEQQSKKCPELAHFLLIDTFCLILSRTLMLTSSSSLLTSFRHTWATQRDLGCETYRTLVSARTWSCWDLGLVSVSGLDGLGLPTKVTRRRFTKWRGKSTIECLSSSAMRITSPIILRIWLKPSLWTSGVSIPASNCSGRYRGPLGISAAVPILAFQCLTPSKLGLLSTRTRLPIMLPYAAATRRYF